MAFLNYEYKMEIGYEEAVSKCYFTIKVIPADDLRQKELKHEISMFPGDGYQSGVDSFGNKQIYGCVNKPHDKFTFVISGLVETKESPFVALVEENTVGMYKYAHGLCRAGEAINNLYKEIAESVEYKNVTSEVELCELIMKYVYGSLKYQKGSTDVDTSAEAALSARAGVCQDYAHIFITLLRMFKIPARYVCGFVVGAGESHAWVEAACAGQWAAFDPTYNKRVTEGYIKTGVGRDAVDCTINRGIMWGGGAQTQKVEVLVESFWDETIKGEQ